MDEPVKQKALEIARAVFRVCALVKREKLKAELENAAVDLTARIFAPDASKGEYLAYMEIIRRLERLIVLAEAAGEIKPVNVSVLLRECGNLVSACGDSVARRAASEEEANLEKFFSNLNKDGGQSDSVVGETANPASNPAIRQSTGRLADQQGNPANEGWLIPASSTAEIAPIRQSGNWQKEGDGFAGLVRRSLILDKARADGGCRIKDLAAAFPGVSERTLRYNLLKLCEAGELVKIGGGPAARYLIKNGIGEQDSN